MDLRGESKKAGILPYQKNKSLLNKGGAGGASGVNKSILSQGGYEIHTNENEVRSNSSSPNTRLYRAIRHSD